MIWILSITICLALAITIFLKVPYSATKKHFNNDINSHAKCMLQTDLKITQQDIKALPKPVQNHFYVSGYLGKRRMSLVKAYITSAPLKDSNDKPPMLVDYTLCSFADELVRLAYIKTSISIFGIPFEAYDSTQNGVDFMKGVPW